jgi:hypothetical protein
MNPRLAYAHQRAIDLADEAAEAADADIDRRVVDLLAEVADSDVYAAITRDNGQVRREGQPVDTLLHEIVQGDDIDGQQPYSALRDALTAAAHASRLPASDQRRAHYLQLAGELLLRSLERQATIQAEQEIMQ